MNLKSVSFFFISCLLFQASAHSAVYKCLDKNGKTSYKDKPCAVTQKKQVVKIRKVKKQASVNSKSSNKNAFFEAQDKRLNEFNQAQNNSSYMATPKVLDIKPSYKISRKGKMSNKQYANYMKIKEKTGATMTADEKNWRNWDTAKMNKIVKKHNKLLTPEELRQQQQQFKLNQERANSRLSRESYKLHNPNHNF